MNRRVLPLIIGSLLLPLGCGGSLSPSSLPGPNGNDDGPLVLQPGDLCSDHPDAAIATFEDATLETGVRAALALGVPDDLTCGLLSGLTEVTIVSGGIESLVGIQNLTTIRRLGLLGNPITDISALSGLTSLTALALQSNSITDISALSGLTSLTELGLDINSITDISALRGLTSLTRLSLDSNTNLSNIQPLLDNTGLGAGDEINLSSTNVSCTDVALLVAKGATVTGIAPC